MELLKMVGEMSGFNKIKETVLACGIEVADNVSNDLTYISGECYYNACKNKSVYEKKYKKNLKVVVGSLGLNGHFEFGGKNWTAEDFYKNPFDSHAWLEDDEGNVYDYIFAKYGFFAKHWNKEVTFPLKHEIVGVSKKELESKYKLEFIKAPRNTQKDIVKNVLCKYKQLSPQKYQVVKMVF